MYSANEYKGDPVLWRLYWGFMLVDIAHKLEIDATPYVKMRLHEMHKKYLKYPTTQGISQQRMSRFLFEVCALWACHGIFVRTHKDQPIGLEEKAFTDLVKMPDGTMKRVWDLL
jgi:hypothetical protein